MKAQLLNNVSDAYKSIELLEIEVRGHRKDLKAKLAEAIEEARTKGDFSISDIATFMGITRQAVNQVLVDVYGVRNEARSEAAKLGHK